MTFDPPSVRATVFDIGGVFSYPRYQPVREQIAAFGLAPPDDVERYRRAHHCGVRALADQAAAPREFDEDYWAVYDGAYGRALGVCDDLLDELRVAIRIDWNWVHQGNVGAFHRLAATGMPLAIVSNNDGTAEQQMLEFGVCQIGPGPLPSVAAVVDSTVVGVAKPDPRIFEPAITALGAEPCNVLYVGDTVHADVAGALAAGMQVVQLDPFDDHADFDHSRATSVDDVVEALVR